MSSSTSTRSNSSSKSTSSTKLLDEGRLSPQPQPTLTIQTNQPKGSLSLPPARPSPTQPIPPTPERLAAETEEKKTFVDRVKLGPSGTIRGSASGSGIGNSSSNSISSTGRRPRGATISTVPIGQSKNEFQPRLRPRSLLSNEISLEQQYESLLLSSSRSSSSSIDSTPSSASSSAEAASIMATATSVGHSTEPMATGAVVASSTSPTALNHASSATEVEAKSAPPLTSAPSSSAASFASSSAIASGSRNSYSLETRSRSGSGTGLLQHLQSRPRSHASFVIAVVGHKASGKSTVIRKGLRQFGLSRPTILSDKITSYSTMCIVDQEQRTIEVLEMDASILLNGPSKRFAWPKSLPYIDAAILCYDASEISSFRGMSELLENFAMNQLSTVMLACKSELSPKAVDPYYASDMASVYNVGLAECSVQSEDGRKRMRDCFSYLVKEVAKSRAVSQAQNAQQHQHQNQHQHQQQQQHHHPHPTNLYHSHTSDSPTCSTTAAAMPVMTYEHSTADSIVSRRRPDRKMSDVTISSVDGGAASEDESALQQSINRAQLGLQSAKSVGGYISIEELFDKFFFAAVSGNDERFLHMFMTFYRGFARPVELLDQISERFTALSRGEKSDGVMIRYSLMKLTTMLGDWMQEYPGDLSNPEAFTRLCDFFEQLLQHPATMHVATPMQPLLDVVRSAHDLDAAWSKDQDNHKPRSVAADVPSVKPLGNDAEQRDRASSTSSSSHGPIAHATTPSDEGYHVLELKRLRNRSASDLSVSSEGLPIAPRMENVTKSQHSGSSSSVNTPYGSGSHVLSNGSSASIAQQRSNGATPSGSGGSAGVEKIHYQNQKATLRAMSNALFDVREEDIAKELTRIEWDLFCTIGPRDLLRHILVSRKVRSTDSPIAQSIAQFNYVSAWVASSILVQSKAKQRARMLEKFMEVATILRRTNNYNTLHAVLAGLTNASIYRLKHTRDMINGKPVMKQYQSLTRLMGSERSFAAYRLALDNSEGRTIPFLGVHLQDILSTSDANPSKRADGMIHWRKFSLMYDAVMAIVRCQQYQMPLPENTALSQLILHLPVMDEDQLYRRSTQVEPRQSGNISIGGGGGSSAAATGSHIIKQIFSLDN